MLCSVLSSKRAIAVNIEIMRAFVKLRGRLASNDERARPSGDPESHLEKRLTGHDEAIAAILSAIRQLLTPPASKTRGGGFTADLEDPGNQ